MIQPNEEEKQLLADGKMIAAIKSLRIRTGINLKDCIITVRAWKGCCPHGWILTEDGVASGCLECK